MGGFFPKKESEAKKVIEKNIKLNYPFVFFDSPKRLIKTLQWLTENYNATHLTIGKELTKKHEKIFYGPPETILTSLKKKRL